MMQRYLKQHFYLAAAIYVHFVIVASTFQQCVVGYWVTCGAKYFHAFCLLLSMRNMTRRDLLLRHCVPECGFEGLKTYPAPSHIWDLPR